MKCKDCKWWITESEYNAGKDIGKGECHSPKLWIDDNEHFDIARKIEEEQEEKDIYEDVADRLRKEALAAACDASGLAYFITLPDFGCNCWEEK